MPRKKRTIETVLEDEPEKETQIENAESDIENALKSVPGGVTTIKLYRVLPQGGRPKFLTELSPEEFSESNVKEMYGGGSYKIRAQKSNGKWGVSMFDIEGYPKKLKPTDMEEDPDEEEDEPQPIPQPQQVVQQASQFDAFAMMKMMQAAEDRGEARMMKMLELMRPQQQSPDVTKQVFEIVEKIAPMMAGGDGGGSPLMMVLGQFKEPIVKIIDSIHAAMSRPAVIPSGPPPHVHAQVQPNPPQPKEEDMLKLLIRQYLPVFINAARQNGNPDLYADMILEQIPQNMYPKLEQWLSTPVWFDDVKSHDPIVIEAQAGWWNLLRASLLEGMKPDAASDLQPASDTEHGQD